MPKCKLCKLNLATQQIVTNKKELNICDSCSIELQNSFKFFIQGQEVTQEEYMRGIIK